MEFSGHILAKAMSVGSAPALGDGKTIEMIRSFLVRVVNVEGRPQANVKVSCFIYQVLANGTKEAWTNELGEAYFSLDVDNHAEVALSICGGRRQIRRGPILGTYHIEA